MDWGGFMTIRTRLLLLVFFATLPMVALAVHLGLRTVEESRKTAQAHAEAVAGTVRHVLDNELNTITLGLKVMATSRDLDAEAGEDGLRRFYAEAETFAREHGTNLVLVDRDGRQLVNTARPFGSWLPMSNASREGQEVLSQAKPRITDVYVGTVLQEPLVSVLVPVVRQNKVVRVLALNLLADDIQKLIGATPRPREWGLAVLDSQGRFVARSRRPAPGELARPGLPEAARARISGWVDTVTREGIPVSNILLPSAVAPWTVVVGIPKGQLLEPALTVSLGLAAMALVTLALSWTAAGYFGRTVTRAVRGLAEESGPATASGISEVDAAATRLHAMESRFEATFENAPVGMAIVHLDGCWQRVNPKLCEILGRTRDQLIGSTIQDLAHPDDRAADLQAASAFLAGHIDVYEVEKRCLHSSGEVVWVRLTASMVRQDNGRPDYFVAVIEDIQPRRRAEAKLRDSLAFERSLMESLALPVFVKDGDGRYIKCNSAFLRFMAAAEAEVIGRSSADLLGLGESAVHREHDRRVMELGQPSRVDARITNRQGVTREVVVSKAPFRLADGSLGGLIGTLTDISDIKHIESELRASRLRLQAVLDNSPSLIGYWDKNQTCIFANRAYYDWFGIEPSTITGHPISELLGAELYELNRHHIEAALQGEKQEFERSFPFPGGLGVRHALAQYIPDVEAGAVKGFYAQISDVTAVKVAEEALRDAQRRQEAQRIQIIEHQRDTLVREVHHRIKNHLQGVTGLLRERIRSNPALAPALDEAIAQLRLIADVYGLDAQGDAPATLDHLVRLAMRSNLGTAPLHYAGPGAAQLPPLARDDVVPLALVINELLTNALKHTVPADPPSPVEISLIGDAHTATVRVVNGPAHLPAGFSLAASRDYGSGLDLVMALLPHGRARLDIREAEDQVVAELVLSPP
jgi:PAS domain S-box-containing protein